MKKHRTDLTACGRGELLVSVLYGEATADERAEFEAHRVVCASCEDEFTAFSKLRGEMSGWDLGAVPAIRVEIRPSLIERLKQAFTLLPMTARLATVGAMALLVLAAFNTRVEVGPNGVSLQTGLAPAPAVASVEQPTPAPGAGPAVVTVSQEDLDQMIAERCDAIVEARFDAYRRDVDAQLASFEEDLASSQSREVRQIALKHAALRKKFDELQRDVDRQAGYGGADLLFSLEMGQESPEN